MAWTFDPNKSYEQNLASYRANVTTATGRDLPDNDPNMVALAAQQQQWIQGHTGQGNNPTGPAYDVPTPVSTTSPAGRTNPFLGNALPRYNFGGFGFYPGGDNRANQGLLSQPTQYQPPSGGGLITNPALTPSAPPVRPSVVADGGSFTQNNPNVSGGGGLLTTGGNGITGSTITGGGGTGLLGGGVSITPSGYGNTPEAPGGFGTLPLPAGQTPTPPPREAAQQPLYQMFTAPNGATIPTFMTGATYGQSDPSTYAARNSYYQSLTDPRQQADFLGQNIDIMNAIRGQMGTPGFNQWANAAQLAPSGGK